MSKLNLTDNNNFVNGQEVSFDIEIHTIVLIESDVVAINTIAENSLIHNHNNIFLNEIDYKAIGVTNDNKIILNVVGIISKD